MRRGGFTLLEMLFVVLIMSIISGILFAAMYQSRIIFQAADISVGLQAEARQAIQRIMLDVSRTNRSRIIITPNYPAAGTDQLTYQLPSYSGTPSEPTLTGGAITWDANACTINRDPAVTIPVLHTPGSTAPVAAPLLQSQGGSSSVWATHANQVNFYDHNRDPALYLDEVRISLLMRQTSKEGYVYSTSAVATVKMRN